MNRQTVLAANRTSSCDPVIQAIISDEMGQLRQRILNSSELDGLRSEVASAALHAWLVFVRAICVEWLANEAFSRCPIDTGIFPRQQTQSGSRPEGRPPL
ncbi:hypothetical protein [Saccharopolyspora spinosa]|uniref:hypothetical protein n=1 Tax=Saccharopolyspora spinosa TaxID=60894 RepID=UPI0002FF5355|nr:hypothetical protein [Saccharopolyspora spinosa]